MIIDELGRGTSTSEGFGLAWAIAKYLYSRVECFCLFATHFHEMTSLADENRGVRNFYVDAYVVDKTLIMLYKVREGKRHKSFGISVMEMLQFPENITKVSEVKLRELESL